MFILANESKSLYYTGSNTYLGTVATSSNIDEAVVFDTLEDAAQTYRLLDSPPTGWKVHPLVPGYRILYELPSQADINLYRHVKEIQETGSILYAADRLREALDELS